jgi:hypothetical protein
MSARTRVALTFGFSLALLGAAAWGQEHWSAAERSRIFATLPDWSGLWEPKVSALSDNLTGYPAGSFDATHKASDLARLIPLIAATPPYRPEWLRAQRAKTDPAAAAGSAAPIKLCRDVPFPALLELPLMFQVAVTPEETLFLYENGDVRHIYSDREHPKKEDLWPTKRGNSIGRWKGATLFIDTIEVNSGPLLGPGTADLSEQAHFTERVRMLDSNTLQDDLTIEDPVRFAHPWHVLTQWTRVLDQDRMLPYDCENDRNPVVNGKFSIATPR